MTKNKQTTIITAEDTQETATVRRDGRDDRGGCLGGMTILLTCLAIPGLCMGTLFIAVGFAVITGVSTLTNAVDSIVDGFREVFNPDPATAEVISTQTLVQRIQPLGQVVSFSVGLAKADVRIVVKAGIGDTCQHSASHLVQGTVEAGIDLTKLNADDIFYNPLTGTYTITLPSPELTNCRIDLIDQYNRSFTMCDVNWDDLRQLAQYSSISDFRGESLESGILDRAEDEAHGILTNFLELATGSTINIEFEEPDPGVVAMTPSCNPQEPAGWSINDDGQTWSK